MYWGPAPWTTAGYAQNTVQHVTEKKNPRVLQIQGARSGISHELRRKRVQVIFIATATEHDRARIVVDVVREAACIVLVLLLFVVIVVVDGPTIRRTVQTRAPHPR